MASEPFFMFDMSGEYYTIAPGNIITGSNMTYLLALLCSKTYYFALRAYYMGGGIEGELKTNRLLILPVMAFENMRHGNLVSSLASDYLETKNAENLLNIDTIIQDEIGLTAEERNVIYTCHY
jgi:site-specific DNA-methyltransferase (adenine-specific)